MCNAHNTIRISWKREAQSDASEEKKRQPKNESTKEDTPDGFTFQRQGRLPFEVSPTTIFQRRSVTSCKRSRRDSISSPLYFGK